MQQAAFEKADRVQDIAIVRGMCAHQIATSRAADYGLTQNEEKPK
jgi:hypothetical protein